MLHHETCGHISSTSRLNRLCSQETVGPKRLHSRSKRQAQTVCKARGAQLAETKRKIVQLAGMKNGLDRYRLQYTHMMVARASATIRYLCPV